MDNEENVICKQQLLPNTQAHYQPIKISYWRQIHVEKADTIHIATTTEGNRKWEHIKHFEDIKN